MASLTSLYAPLTLISPHTSLHRLWSMLIPIFSSRLGTICLTSSLAPPPGSARLLCHSLCPPLVSLGFCSCLCVSRMLPVSLVPLCLFLSCMISTPCSVSFSTSVCFSLRLRSPFPTLCITLCLCSPFRIWAGPLTCPVASLPDGSPWTPQVLPPPWPRHSSAVTPATLPNPATVPTKCQEDEVCGISIGTSGRRTLV